MSCFRRSTVSLLLIFLSSMTACRQEPPIGEKITTNKNEVESGKTDRKIVHVPDVPLADRYPDIPFNQNEFHRSQAGDIQQDGWCLAASTRGKFSVEFPGKFIDSMLKSKSDVGIAIYHHLDCELTKLHFHAMKVETDLMAGQDVAKKIIESATKKGQKVTSEQVTIGGVSGQLVTVSNWSSFAKTFIAKQQGCEYMIAAESDGNSAKNKDDVARFMNSFTITDH